MSEEIKGMLETGLKALSEKQVALEKSIAQYHGQLEEKSKVDSEVKSEVSKI